MIMTCSTSHCLMTVLGICGLNKCMYVCTYLCYKNKDLFTTIKFDTRQHYNLHLPSVSLKKLQTVIFYMGLKI